MPEAEKSLNAEYEDITSDMDLEEDI